MQLNPVLLTLCFGLLVVVVGCGDGGPSRGKVHGVVKLDGVPVPEASVGFAPSIGRTSVGNTDENGKYTLMYSPGKTGAVLGEHKVTVSVEEVLDARGNVQNSPGSNIPMSYRKPESTPLSFTVESGSNEFNIDLDSNFKAK